MLQLLHMETIIKTLQEKLQKTKEHFENDIRTLRTGRANAALVEDIKVDLYGSAMRVKDVASITVPDPMSIVINPWDKTASKPIEDGIRAANLGYGVNNMGEYVRVTLPELSAERRDELKKMVQRKAEDTKVAMRNSRRDAVDDIKKMEKNKEISEDQVKKSETDIQKHLDNAIRDLEQITDKKLQEITL